MIRDLENWLKGAWSLEKSIYDALTPHRGTFTGVAFFKEIEPHKVKYTEEGILTYGTYEGTGLQEYLYEFSHPYEAKVYRPPHGFFHTLDLRLGFWKVEHVCGQDHYTGRFSVLSQEEWTVSWRVKGPRKNLEMTYRYTRGQEDSSQVP